jgi:hypothetical protein
MGHENVADKKPLLHDAEQNIGNSAIVRPQVGPATVIPQDPRDRIINLQGGSGAGQSTTIVMTAARIVGAENPLPGFPGPITGILEYGNGGRSTRVEFDIPVGPFDGTINEASSAIEPQDGIVTITVPTSVVRAYARYDNLLVAPILGTDPPLSHAEFSSVAVLGPGGPVLVADPAAPADPTKNILVSPEPVLVKAMACYFGKASSRVYKTINCYLSNETTNPAPVEIKIGTPDASPISGFPGYAWWTLPAFTKRVKILRFPDSAALKVLLHDGVRPVDFIAIAGGSTAPEIKVVGNQSIIGITSENANIRMLKIVCELGI